MLFIPNILQRLLRFVLLWLLLIFLKAGDLTKDSRIFLAVSSFFRRTDKLLWLLMLTISTFSLILLKSVSRAMNTDYFKTQLVVTVAGLLAALVLSRAARASTRARGSALRAARSRRASL